MSDLRYLRLLIFAVAIGASAQIRVEHVDVPGGAQLETVIAGDFPLISVLVDTLGDSDATNDASRNVWILTCARPRLMQRFFAAVPFMYWHAGAPRRRENSVPAAILDMSASARNTWLKLLLAGTQVEVLDPINMLVRASSRAYSGNTSGFRNAHIWQALSVLPAIKEESLTGSLSEDQLTRVQARLTLNTHMFGDLVGESHLPAALEKERDTRNQDRQRNWDMLRQQAEENGLYFQSLNLSFAKDANVLLWAERRPAAIHPPFSSQFLGIGSPGKGDWLAKWNGYTETWTLDESRTAEMVPVALYSLRHPKKALLLIDFRKPFAPKRSEMIRRAAGDVTAGVLGLTTFGNLWYFAAKTSYTFVRRRHGAAVDSNARLRAYSELRQQLYLDDSLDPRLRIELLRRIDGLGLNPFEEGMATEAQLARDQYAALRAYAAAPNGLVRQLNQSRSKEVAHYVHSKPALAMLRVANITTLGLYKHADPLTPELLAAIDRRRRFAWNQRFLDQVIASRTQPEVTYNFEQLQHSIRVIAQIGQESDEFRARSEQLVKRVLAQISAGGIQATRAHMSLQQAPSLSDGPEGNER